MTTMIRIRKMTATMLLWITVMCLSASAFAADVRSAPLRTSATSTNGMVRVYLSSLGDIASLDLTINGSYTASNGAALSSGTTMEVSFDRSTGQISFLYGGQRYAMGQNAFLKRTSTDASNSVKIQQSRDSQNPYPGDLSFKAVANGNGYKLYTIVHVFIETYLYGVVPYEMGDGWPAEALKAQAVAARTYTVRMMRARASGLYDVVDTTSDQTYRGTPSGSANCKAAVDATRGIVLMNGSEYITTYYSATNGGQTEIARTGTSYAYMTVKDDPFDYDNPSSDVKRANIRKDLSASSNNAQLKTLLKSKAADKLRQMGYSATETDIVLGTLTGMHPHTPKYADPSRLYTKMDFTFTVSTSQASGITLTVTCDIFGELESMLGLSHQSIANELWTVVDNGDSLQIQSRRYGHGMGMSQRGAAQMAKSNYTYDQILGFYYDGCTRVEHSFTQSLLNGSITETPSQPEDNTPSTPSEPDPSTSVQAIVATKSGSLNLRAEPRKSGRLITTIPQYAQITVMDRGEEWCAVVYNGKQGYVMTEFLSFDLQAGTPETPSDPPSGEGTATSAVVTTESGSLNLRAAASKSGKLLKQIPRHASVEVISYGAEWCQVKWQGTTGYVMTKYLTLSSAEQQPEENPEQQPELTPSTQSTAVVHTPSGSLNVRSQPNINAQCLGTIPRKASVEVIAQGDEWCAVRYNALSGYAMTKFLRFTEENETPSSPETEAGTAWVNTVSGSLNLRKAPSTGATILTTIPQYAKVETFGQSGSWTSVRYNGTSGYVMSKFLSDSPKEESSSTNVSSKEPPAIVEGIDVTMEAPERATYAVEVDGRGLALWPSCAEEGEAVAFVPPQEQMEVVLIGQEWACVQYQGKQGYCKVEWLRVME